MMASTNAKSAPVYTPSARSDIPYAIQVDAAPTPAYAAQAHGYPHPSPLMATAVHAQAVLIPVTPTRTRSFERWELPLFGCCSVPAHMLVAFVFPCVSGAYAAHAIRRSAALVGVVLFLTYTASLVFAAASEQADGSWRFFHFSSDDNSDNSDDSYELSKWDTLEAVCAVAFVLTVMWLRHATREFYRIRGSVFNDCCASFWCSCCVLAQLSAHTERVKAHRGLEARVATLPAYPA